MRILSLFDGMACGMLAMQAAGINVDRYVAFEIDKYAIQTSSHNFPMIEHRGDVFQADFTEFRGFDFLIGGSPCTKWSIARTTGREIEASGIGWELFCQYVRALHEAKPKYFIYENNKSMHNNIRTAITEAFGFEPICINSALVSAQNRQRLYWVGKRNPDGTYSRVKVDQPEDKGILLRDVLDCPVAINTTADGDKARTLMSGYYKYGTATLITNKGFTGGITAVAEPINVTADGKARTIRATCYKDGIRNMVGNDVDRRTCVAEPVPFVLGKLPAAVDKFGYVPQMWNPYNNAEITDKAPTLTTASNRQTVSSTVMVVTPLKEDNVLSDEYWHGGFDGPLIGMVETPMTSRNGKQPSQHCRVYSCDDKYVCLGTDSRNRAIVPYDGYATAIEWDGNGKPTKAVSGADGKTYPVYEVKDGQITIKGKQYPIKLADGFYIIRKLTVSECKRLQTVPEWFVFPVSDTQAYKMLGNGWTVEVIALLICATQLYADIKR